MLCALVRNNIIVDIADLSYSQIENIGAIYSSVIEIENMTPQPKIGWTYDGTILSAPGWRITRLAMRQRFTVTELLAIMTYVNTNPSGIVAMLMQNLTVATFVDLKRSDTIAGIQVLVGYGLVTSDRAGIILNTSPSVEEAYTG